MPRGGNRKAMVSEENTVDEETNQVLSEADEVINQGRKVDENTRTQFMIGVPIGLKVALEKYGKENNISIASVARKALADAIGYELTEVAKPERASKLTEEQKKERQKARNKEQREMIKLMVARVRAEEGLVDDDEDEEDEA